MLKKIMIAGMAILLACSTLQAGGLLDIAEDVVSIAKVSSMKDPIKAMEEEVSALALQFDHQQRIEYYNENSISLGWPVVKSALFGFGRGLEKIGDAKGAMRASIFEGLGFGVAAFGGLSLVFDMLFIAPWNDADGRTFQTLGIAMVAGGAAVMVVSRISQMARTIIWGNSYNKTMRKSLGLNDDLSLAVLPVPSDNPDIVPLAVVASIRL